MADLQVKARNLCNIVSTTTLHSNAGGLGTFIRNNSISVYMNGSDNTSGVYIATLPEAPSVGETFTISFVPICKADNVLRLNLFGVVQNITYTSGQRMSITFTTPSNVTRAIAFYGGNLTEKTVQIYDIQIESGSTAHYYQPYSSTGWVHSLRKLTTATEAVENPLYSDGTAITAYTIKGNEEHTGAPSPQNPVMPNGVGEMSSNMINYQLLFSNNPVKETDNFRYYRLSVKPNTQYTLKSNAPSTTTPSAQTTFLYGDSDTMTTVNNGVYSDIANTVTSTVEGYIFVAIRKYYQYITEPTETDFANGTYTIMINEGSTALPYEPYGQYKIPILSNGNTYPVYLGEVQTTRQIKKLVFDGSESWEEINTGQASQYFRTITGAYNSLIPDLVLSTHYEYTDINSSTTANGIDAYNSGTAMTAGIAVRDNTFATVAAFKTWLSENPITVWYVLATPTTGIVNEPLMKIGNYADSISNAVAIPTTEGANSITVDTTVQPSAFSATWSGWHDSSVQEYVGGVGNNKINPIAYKTDYYISAEGVETPFDDFNIYCAKAKSSTQYTLSVNRTLSGSNVCIHAYNNGVWLSQLAYVNVANLPTSVTTPSNCDEIRLSIYNAADGYLMLNEGSTALPFEPYQYGWV